MRYFRSRSSTGGGLVSFFGLYLQRPAEETMMSYLQVVDAVNLSHLARDQGG
ncbi:hypothetical protein PQR53_28670 [Paraburkholderia fungorum]|uniref:hypothetical protein n=1 Tax=Paraburkholderia fungorum TaxID=134537 RepID=UPI0038B7604E